jgi:hypothetical protein
MPDLKCNGVYRDTMDKNVACVVFNRALTDDELRKIHDAVRSALQPDPDTKVVRLHDGQPQTESGVPSKGLIHAVEQTLELARSGQLQSLWGTGFTSDGLRFVVKGGKHDNIYEMAGALTFLGEEYRDTVFDTNNRKD